MGLFSPVHRRRLLPESAMGRRLIPLLALLPILAWPLAASAFDSTASEFLVAGATRGNAKDVIESLKAGADPDARDAAKRPAVFLAALTGKAEVVEPLLAAHATTLNEAHDVDGQAATPLSLATWLDRPALVDLMLAYGADPAMADQVALRGAVVNGSTRHTRLLLERGADAGHRFADGQRPMTIAAMRGHTEVLALLVERKAGVNVRDDAGDTPLMFAAAQGKESSVRLLLDNGALANLFDVDGRTALSVARQIPEAVTRARIEALLSGRGAASAAIQRPVDGQYLVAAHDGNLAKTTQLLDQGAELEVRGIMNPKLWLRDALSASVAHPSVCRFLLEKGINAHMTDGAGFTAMHAAAQEGVPECIRLLAERGLDANARSKSGYTPLNMAINRRRPPEVVAALLQAGADPNGPPLSGAGSLAGEARARGLVKVASLLQEAGGAP